MDKLMQQLDEEYFSEKEASEHIGIHFTLFNRWVRTNRYGIMDAIVINSRHVSKRLFYKKHIEEIKKEYRGE